ncbi:superfamily protein [Moumouvirus goulette]|uniref:Superfamily protein n=1 Tax=Moumouvirus goulette TaxID=1247379 RepID=M1PG97_9VIRU|nr:superfamily protein [Moumouvirus goulette]AGF85003.1 superfamily protein [Moumouvirus goulette]
MSELEILYQNYIKAKYEYLKKFSEKAIPQFISETKDYVWDKDHHLYNYINNIPIHKPDENIKNLYKKLAILFHPDKCNESWSCEIFQLVNESYLKNDFNKLNELDEFYNKHKTFDNYFSDDNSLDLLKQIKKMESEVWYIWTSPDADVNYRNILKGIFVPVKEYEIRCQERYNILIEENIKLKKQNDELYELLDRCSKFN